MLMLKKKAHIYNQYNRTEKGQRIDESQNGSPKSRYTVPRAVKNILDMMQNRDSPIKP